MGFRADGRQAGDRLVGKTARLWDVATAREIVRLGGHEDIAVAVAFSPDSRTLVTGATDRTAASWDVDTRKQLTVLRGHDGRKPSEGHVSAVIFSPDDRLVVTGSQDKSVRLREASTGRAIGVLRGHRGQILSVTFTRDGRTLATASGDGTARR